MKDRYSSRLGNTSLGKSGSAYSSRLGSSRSLGNSRLGGEGGFRLFGAFGRIGKSTWGKLGGKLGRAFGSGAGGLAKLTGRAFGGSGKGGLSGLVGSGWGSVAPWGGGTRGIANARGFGGGLGRQGRRLGGLALGGWRWPFGGSDYTAPDPPSATQPGWLEAEPPPDPEQVLEELQQATKNFVEAQIAGNESSAAYYERRIRELQQSLDFAERLKAEWNYRAATVANAARDLRARATERFNTATEEAPWRRAYNRLRAAYSVYQDEQDADERLRTWGFFRSELGRAVLAERLRWQRRRRRR